MPIYEYKCKSCGKIIEVAHAQPLKAVICNSCGKETEIIVSGHAKTPGGWA